MWNFFKKIFSFFTVNPEVKAVIELISARRLAIKIARERPTKVKEMIKYFDLLLDLNGIGLQKFYLMTVQGIIKEIDGDPLLRSDLETILTLIRVKGDVDISKFHNFLKGFREGLTYGTR